VRHNRAAVRCLKRNVKGLKVELNAIPIVTDQKRFCPGSIKSHGPLCTVDVHSTSSTLLGARAQWTRRGRERRRLPIKDVVQDHDSSSRNKLWLINQALHVAVTYPRRARSGCPITALEYIAFRGHRRGVLRVRPSNLGSSPFTLLVRRLAVHDASVHGQPDFDSTIMP
jgi:hypothetical protein